VTVSESEPSPSKHRVRLPLEGILRRKIEERHPLTPEEHAEVVRSEALNPSPPWARVGPQGSPTAKEYANSIGYPWTATTDSEANAFSVLWRVRNALRILTRRGRQVRTLRALLVEEVATVRWKQLMFLRHQTEADQTQQLVRWWGEYHETIDEDMMDDLEHIYPNYSEAELRTEIAQWGRDNRWRRVEAARSRRAGSVPR
jgi:hypothetical protein